ncbi:thioredoxin domain-containing protein [uncultured Microbulbifer sp.]|uniref:thioredoxin domain-containing protein n=1 Tax=uncultured Microbulbifer sp. TaxID=348147 RepID=UPI0026218689|nr:thioredoxin domain-containing protein [uncultured Microbulbifer sp.]
MWLFKLLLRLIVLISIGCIVTGCIKERKIVIPESGKVVNSEMAARIDGKEISLRELDQTLQLALYDIAEQEYQLRLSKIYAWPDKESFAKGARERIEVLLKVPEPPRISLPIGYRFIRGDSEAPVTLAVFCSFQSPHCQSIQPVIQRLTTNYKDWVKVAYFDFPLKFHREGIKAAVAARCAAEQNKFWEYHDALYTFTPELDDATYAQLIKQLQIDDDKFVKCFSSDTPKKAVLKDRDRALALGLKNVPVIFINGLYLKGLRTYEQYAFWVDKELRSLGVNPKQKQAQRTDDIADDRELPITQLPLILLGVSESSIEKNSRALITAEETAAKYYNVGNEVIENVWLLRLYSNFAVIKSEIGLERLPLKGKEGAGILLTRFREQSEELAQRIEQPLGPGTRKLIASSGVLTLGQAWLSEQLEQQDALEAKFTEAELEVEGHRLMRLEGVQDNEFFTALGFQDNDVLLRVNDSWVHSGQNNLWDALTSGQVIDVAFMRKGLPQRIQYVVEELGYFDESSDNEKD